MLDWEYDIDCAVGKNDTTCKDANADIVTEPSDTTSSVPEESTFICNVPDDENSGWAEIEAGKNFVK